MFINNTKLFYVLWAITLAVAIKNNAFNAVKASKVQPILDIKISD